MRAVRPGRALWVLVLGVIALLPSGPLLAQDPAASPAPSPAASPVLTFDDDAIPVAPMPGGIVEPRPVGWDHVTIWPDGRTLTVYFWNGAEACFGLDRVELADVDGTLSVTLFTGFRVDAANKRCIAMEQLYSTVIQLETSILGGGVPDVVGVQPGSGDGQPIAPGAILVGDPVAAWERVTVAPDGRTLLVGFSGGVPECFGLDRVETPDIDGIRQVIIRYGDLAERPDVCILPALLYETPVTLPEPILLGGVA